jgi:hypothetical protein
MSRAWTLLICIAAAQASAQDATLPRSVVFDKKAAEAARETPTYVESIVVIGRDPDARPAKPRSLEQRFAEALIVPRPSLAAGRMFDNTPCMSLPSTWNNIGDAHVPLSGCP